MGNLLAKGPDAELVGRIPTQVLKDVEYMVFGVGSIRGLALLRAYIELLIRQKIDVRKLRGVAGVSAGAILCLLIVLQFTPAELEDLQSTSNRVSVTTICLERTCDRWSFLDATPLQNLLQSWMVLKGYSPHATFAELRTDIDMRVFAYDIMNNKLELFGPKFTPDVSVVSAVLASCSMPFVFRPVKIGLKCYVDGAFAELFPFRTFPTQTTLGLYLYDRHRKLPQATKNFFQTLSLEEKDRIIAMDVSQMSALEMKPSADMLKYILSVGECAVANYYAAEV
jgi:predicted acylesterase/phospholipase RssA